MLGWLGQRVRRLGLTIGGSAFFSFFSLFYLSWQCAFQNRTDCMLPWLVAGVPEPREGQSLGFVTFENNPFTNHKRRQKRDERKALGGGVASAHKAVFPLRWF